MTENFGSRSILGLWTDIEERTRQPIEVKEGDFIVLYGIQGVGKTYNLNGFKRDYQEEACFLWGADYKQNYASEVQHRIEVLKAVAQPYKVFLLDEPTHHLMDRKARVELLTAIRRIHDHGHTIVMATHDFAAMEMATRIIEMFPDKSFIEHGPGLHRIFR